MKKVVHVSLAGRAYQVEEAGYTDLRQYLDDAAQRLQNNPDKDDILRDIEQSIADKCTITLQDGKDVIAAATVTDALEKIGPVETDAQDEMPAATPAAERTRKLYRLPQQGSIAGVCAGLAAYFNVDITIMRLLFVLLLFLTQGLMILIYIGMAIVLPTANTPEQIAEAYGRPDTAKAIMDNIKQTMADPDTVTRIGVVISVVGKVIAMGLLLCFAVGFIAVTIGWIWLLWAIGLGTLQFSEQLAVLNGWRQVVFVSAAYAVVALPLLAAVNALHTITHPGIKQTGKKTALTYGAITIGIVLATVTLFAFFSAYAPRVQTYVDTHDGYLQMGEYRFCADAARCGNST